MTWQLPAGVDIRAPYSQGDEKVLSAEALTFLADLERRFGPRRRELLQRRLQRQQAFDRGELPHFLEETRGVREGEWRVAPPPADLLDRRVEITGPVDAKMIINALNSGAQAFMADFEDATAPTWRNLVEGQGHLAQAVRLRLRYVAPQGGKEYILGDRLATLLVRPRGLHLPESHLEVDGQAMSGSFFDFGLYFFHNAKALLERGSGPYFYLPKLESHLEARLWNEAFVYAQQRLGLPEGSIKATVLIETLPAAFEMEEILYELREHSVGLNCGRWDYIFSFIKTHRAHAWAVLPDRALVTMNEGFLRAYSQLLIRTCHRRGAHAMGGMAAQIPIKDDAEANAAALARVRADKEREARDGHDGTWVAHPGLVVLAREIFDAHMPGKNQIERLREDVVVSAEDLLRIPQGKRSEAGMRSNIRVALRYLEAWLQGQGCVPLYSLMEDAATAEISRTQLWQWLRQGAEVESAPLSVERFDKALAEEMSKVAEEVGAARFAAGRFAEAKALLESLVKAETCPDFLTLPAYEALLKHEPAA